MEALNLLSDTLELAKRHGADAADAIMFDSTELSVSCRMGAQEGLERAESNGLGLRVFVGDRQACVSTTDTSHVTVSEMVIRAVEMARASPPDKDSTLADVALLARDIPDLDLYDHTEPTAEWLQEQCLRAENAALAVKGISNSEGADAQYSAHTIALATSHGFLHAYSTSNCSVSLSVLAGTGTAMERDYDYSSARFIHDLEDAETIGRSAAARTLKRLNPRKVSTTHVPVVFDPRAGKQLLSALVGAISGSSIARGTSFLKEHLGKPIFPESITITDDPHIVRGHASRPFDAEGVANRKRAIIDRGMLTTWLLDVRSANKLGLTTTGHATRGLASPPSPSCTNFYMHAGSLTPHALMADITQGLYVTDLFGMGVNLITGDYSQGASGLWIENGEIAYPVSEITIAGSLLSMFAQSTPADDLVFKYGINAPTLRVDGMTVAGT